MILLSPWFIAVFGYYWLQVYLEQNKPYEAWNKIFRDDYESGKIGWYEYWSFRLGNVDWLGWLRRLVGPPPRK